MIMEGYLDKWTNYITGWKNRWCILNNGVFYYCNRKGDKPRGMFHMAITCFAIKGEKEFHLEVGTKKVYFRTENKIERDNWYNALRVAKFDYNKMNSQISTDKERMNENLNLLNDDKIYTFLNSTLKTKLDNINRYNNILGDVAKASNHFHLKKIFQDIKVRIYIK
jgi:collagen type IV alpha-3-binding protein